MDKAYEYNTEGKSGKLPRKNVYSACERHGVALVAMKPFAGGFVLGLEKDAGFTPVNLISYALAQTGLTTVVPGCENSQQMQETLTYYTCSNEEKDYAAAIAESRWRVRGNCLYCNHCLPCPVGINIAGVNKWVHQFDAAKPSEKTPLLDEASALLAKVSACTRCGKCEARCPFAVPVMPIMEGIKKRLAT